MTLRRAVSFALAALLSWPASRPATAQEPPPETISSPADLVTDKAIHRALEHLKTTQKPSGAWDGGFGEATSITSLAVMAYLAVGTCPRRTGALSRHGRSRRALCTRPPACRRHAGLQ